MRNLQIRAALAVLVCLVLLPTLVDRAQAGDKVTAEEIIAKHMDSLGPGEVRTAMKNCASQWDTHYVVKMGGQGMADGKGVFITDGNKIAFAMRFPVADYPGERFVFDGEKWDTAKRTTELRSGQAELVKDNSEILREGLFGGVLSSAWPLHNLQIRQAKLKYDGMKKVDGVNLHRVSYTPKKSNNGMLIYLFFDPQTFRHVKTIYQLEIQPGQGKASGMGDLASNQGVSKSDPMGDIAGAGTKYTPNTRYKLEEDFSEFKSFNGYTLPTKWKIRYTWEPSSGQGTTVMDWELALTGIVHNSAVDPKSFELTTVAHPGGSN